MRSIAKRFISVITILAMVGCVLLFVPTNTEAAAAPAQVTIIGTIQQTRNYYDINGAVCAYCFFPATLQAYNIGGKMVELTECGAGTTPELLGTNDLSSYVGVTKAYTGVLAKSNTAPFSYVFCISSVADAQPYTVEDMNAYLTALGFETTPSGLPGSSEYFIGCFGWNHTVTFSYSTQGNSYGQFNAYILKEDFSPDFGLDSYRFGSTAKAQQVAQKLALYGTGKLSRDKLKKYLNTL
ncbi:MAG: hypothetical protein K5888_03685 [Lachnospiraceae bacterium]|nr:hypothetical protein [Lachnospiraceae bacterium]